MLAGVVDVGALVTLAVAAGSLGCLEQDERNSLRLLAAGVGVVASIALIVSAILLADGWAAWFAHYDVAAWVPLDKWSRGSFPYIVVLSWPYEAMALGAFCLYWFGRKLYELAWVAGWV
jgi:hypothetical protein